MAAHCIIKKIGIEASRCHDAEDQLRVATSAAEIEQASRKVRMLCRF
ncbi:MAG: hypothetical protein HQ498_12035 [Pseudohongiella sp.]|nr:hypothetical protein [Pseudohongiella sp.]